MLMGVLKRNDYRFIYVSSWGTEQPGSSFGLIFLLFPKKITRGHAHSSRGKFPTPALNDSPER